MKKTASGDALDRALTDLYQTDIPAGYPASWRDAVKREEPTPMKPSPSLTWLRRAALPMAAALVLIVGTLITGALNPQTTTTLQAADTSEEAPAGAVFGIATNTADSGMERTADAVYAAVPAPEYDDELSSSMAKGTVVTAEDAEEETGSKIVRTVSLTLSTTDFDPDYDAVLALAESAGGYASSINLYDRQTGKRTASFTLRIPAEALDGFLTDLETVCRITERCETADDYTTQYSDTELRLQTQRDKLSRLQELMAQAETVEDLLQIESEIADTQYWIDSLESSLRGIDRQVDYATVSVYLQEQQAIDTAVTEDLSLGARIRYGLEATATWLGRFFENMLVFLVAAAPVLVPLILLIVVVRIIRKRRKSNNKAKS